MTVLDMLLLGLPLGTACFLLLIGRFFSGMRGDRAFPIIAAANYGFAVMFLYVAFGEAMRLLGNPFFTTPVSRSIPFRLASFIGSVAIAAALYLDRRRKSR